MSDNCVILKRKEFNALNQEISDLKKTLNKKTLEIIINNYSKWSYDDNDLRITFYLESELYGGSIGEGIKEQIKNILNLLEKKYNKILEKQEEQIKNNIKSLIEVKIRHLPWYKKLFINVEDFKDIM